MLTIFGPFADAQAIVRRSKSGLITLAKLNLTEIGNGGVAILCQ
jgi:Asp-tRNA(Asn)/Glu-tRNA(Gln) amidotransferase A subunit family amidase